MRGAVRAEEEFRVADRRRGPKRQPILLALQDWQAVVMRTQSAGEERVAVEKQMVRRDRGRNAGAGFLHELNAGARADMLEHDPQSGKALDEVCEHGFDEACFAV